MRELTLTKKNIFDIYQTLERILFTTAEAKYIKAYMMHTFKVEHDALIEASKTDILEYNKYTQELMAFIQPYSAYDNGRLLLNKGLLNFRKDITQDEIDTCSQGVDVMREKYREAIIGRNKELEALRQLYDQHVSYTGPLFLLTMLPSEISDSDMVTLFPVIQVVKNYDE